MHNSKIVSIRQTFCAKTATWVLTLLLSLSAVAQSENKVVVIPLGGNDSKSFLEQCQWIQGAGCELGQAANSTCTTSADCPEGSIIVSGGCQGFTSVAIGRSSRSFPNSWSCFYRRISSIDRANLLRAEAFCCSK